MLMDVRRLKVAAKAAAKAMKDSMGPGRYAPGGNPLSCPHCGGDRFQAMNLGLVKGCPLACEDCGLVQWFSARPERSDDA